MTSNAPDPRRVGNRWSVARRIGGFGAAATMSLYLVVKVVWVAAGLLGDGLPGSWGAADWVLLNTATVLMSAAGVALGLALALPWGMRLPAGVVIPFAWLGTGFLVPLVPFALLAALLGALGVTTGGGEESPADQTAMPAWEDAFIAIGFAGMAAGLALALPIYLRERWPGAFLGRLGDIAVSEAAGRAFRPPALVWFGLLGAVASGA